MKTQLALRDSFAFGQWGWGVFQEVVNVVQAFADFALEFEGFLVPFLGLVGELAVRERGFFSGHKFVRRVTY